MQNFNGKREIEAICDSWQGGLVTYMIRKLKEALEQFENEERGIGLDDLQDIEDDKDRLELDETVDVRDSVSIYDV